MSCGDHSTAFNSNQALRGINPPSKFGDWHQISWLRAAKRLGASSRNSVPVHEFRQMKRILEINALEEVHKAVVQAAPVWEEQHNCDAPPVSDSA